MIILIEILFLKILFVSKHWGKMFLFLFWDNQMAQRLASLDNTVNSQHGYKLFFSKMTIKLNCTKICFTYLLNMTEKHANKVFKYLILVLYIYIMFRIYRFFKNYNSFPIFLVCFKSVWKTYTYTVV